MRLAEEYDAAQERGDVPKQGSHVAGENMMATADLGIRRDEIYEARKMRDAEIQSPGIISRTIEGMVERGEEPVTLRAW